MAELPRWVPSRRVDSSAMLSAFLAYRGRCSAEEKEALGHLYMVEHAERKTINIFGVELEPQKVPAPLPSVPCAEPACERCLTRRGGYQFRWYSKLWEENYRKGRRQGSWLPGEPVVDEEDLGRPGPGAPCTTRGATGQKKVKVALITDQAYDTELLPVDGPTVQG